MADFFVNDGWSSMWQLWQRTAASMPAESESDSILFKIDRRVAVNRALSEISTAEHEGTSHPTQIVTKKKMKHAKNQMC